MRIVLTTAPFAYLAEGIGGKRKSKVNIGHYPFLGIGYLAGMLQKYGYEVKVLDPLALSLSLDETLSEIWKLDPDVIGISTLTPWALRSYELAKRIKQKKDIPLILGGAHVSCFPDETAQHCPQADALVIGEGELTIVELAEALKEENSFESIAGIWYRNKDRKLIKNPPRAPCPDLDSLPSPALHLFPLRYYRPSPHQAKRTPSLPLISSRGCAWSKCTFCYMSDILKTQYRRNSTQRVVQEMKRLKEDFGARDIVFFDEDFVSDQEWTMQFCELLQKEDLALTWSCQARVDTVSLSLLKTMKRAGCYSIFYGLETADEKVFNSLRKGTTVAQARKAVQWTHDAGIEMIRAGFIFALPGASPAIDQRTIEFAKELDLDFPMFQGLTPLPKTEIFDICLRRGKIEMDDIYGYKGFLTAPYIPEGYKDREQLKAMIKKAYRDFYLRPRYFWKQVKKIKAWDDVKKWLTLSKMIFEVDLFRN